MRAPPLIIRVFSDHAGSPLWLTGYGNIDPETLKLDADICGRLHAWADYFSRNFTFVGRDMDWIMGADGDQYDSDGLDLAREMSRELGHDFVIEFWSMKGQSPKNRIRFRDRHEGRIPEAVLIASELIREESG